MPPWATGPALITVGAMMMHELVHIEWDNYGEVEILRRASYSIKTAICSTKIVPYSFERVLFSGATTVM